MLQPDKVYSVFSRICAAIFAVFLCFIIGVIIAGSTGDGMSIPPTGNDKLIIFGLPIIGGLTGALFPRPFGWLFELFSGFSIGPN